MNRQETRCYLYSSLRQRFNSSLRDFPTLELSERPKVMSNRLPSFPTKNVFMIDFWGNCMPPYLCSHDHGQTAGGDLRGSAVCGNTIS